MAKKVKRLVSLILSFVFLMCLIPIFALNPYKAYAADSDQSAYMKYETNYTQQGLDGSFGSYRIWGFINGPQVQTTYNNEGFRITLVENGQQHSVGVAQNGVEKFVADDLWITQNLSIVNNGRYVKVQFVVRNAGNTERTFSLGSGADVQIGTNDCAPITKFDNGSGFYMSDGSQAQFNFIGRGAYGVTDVDTFWYGVWNTVDANMFSPAPAGNLTNTDSGMAFSWQNRTIEPNSSEAFSVLIGIGPLNNPPVTTIDGLNTTLPDSVPGGTYTITGSVSDAENSTGTSIYYAVDDRAPIEAYTFNGAPGNFTATVNIPEDITPGSHTLSVYAQDVDGAISSAVTRTFNIPDTQPLIPDISAEYAGTNTSYTSNTPTNSNITFSTNDSGIECSTDGGNSFTSFSSPMTVSGAGTYIFRYAGVTNSSAYVTYVANINKAFQGNLSGVQDQGKYNISVTPVFTNATAAIIKDNGTPEAFTSNTQITADGNYSLILTDQYGNTAAYSFMVDKTAPTISSVTGNQAEWTESNVTLAVSASDGVSGLADAAYSFDGGSTWQAGNTKTYSSNTDGIVIKVKDNTGNIATYGPFDISNIDKTLPNAAVIANSSSYTDSKWYNENQTITASFTGTPGCSEKLQYKVNDGSWTDGDSVLITDEGRHTVSFRVIDALNRTGQVQTVNVNIDKTTPADSTIKLNTNEFRTFINNITFGLFFKDSVDVTITADDSLSGIKNIEYQKVSDPSEYNPDGTWTEGSSFSIAPDDKFIIYAKITDNAGNYVILNTDGAIVDSTKAELALTPDAVNWTAGDMNVAVIARDNLAGISEVTYTTNETAPQSGTVTLSNGQGTITLRDEGSYILTVTAKDNSGNITTESTNIMIDKSLPVISGVTGNPAEWTEDNVTLTVNASDGVSGLADAAYSFDGGSTWQTGNTKTYNSNTDGIVIKVKDNAGNIATYGPFDISNIDKTLPNAAVIANSGSYTDSKWYNENQTITASFTGTPGCSEKLQYKVNDGSWTDGDSVLISDEGRHTVSFRVIDALNRTGQVQTVNVNIDKTRPVFSGANDNGGYYIGRVINLDDSFDEIGTAIYKKDDGPEKQFVNGALFDEAGRYTLTIKDKAGNENTLSFVVKALPNPEDIVYTSDCKSLIESIAAEFNSHSDLPEPYKSNTKSKIKALQNRYDQLDNEVKSIKSEIINIENKVNNLPGDIDGLISMQDKIQQEYDDITGRNSTFTAEQKSSLLEEAGYLKEELNKIKELEYEVESIKAEAASIPTAEDGLIARQDYIKTILSNISKLTNEQQELLKEQINFLNGLLDKINGLLGNVKTVRDLIKSLPAPESVTKQDAGKIANANELYDKLNNEQKNLVGQELEGELNSVTEALRKLMLYDTTTDTTVTGIDGTSFSPDVYLVVTPINQTDNKTNFKAASDKVEQAVQKISELKNKELISLYDVSMFKGSTKIQPDGKVQVKIKIPDNLKGREELDIIHIADDGTVTSMHAVREGDYLTFVTDHFSKYGIIAKSNCRFGICKAFGIYNPIKGVCYDWLFIAAAVIVLAGTAYAVHKRKGEKQTKESAEADI